MAAERWRQVEELYRAVLERGPEEGAALLADSDPDLRRAVEELLQGAPTATAATSPFSPTPGGAPGDGIPGDSLHPGMELGVYRVEARLGAGGMGEVYRAHDRKLGRDVALKILPAAMRDDPERLERFQQEARLLAALNHPNIAIIHELNDGAGHSFLVMELIEGGTLEARLRGRGLPIVESLRIALQVTDALEAAHARGITHRDIKPSNIALTRSGTVKVLDFGLGKWSDARDDRHAQRSTRAATYAGLIVGTPPYMSPEQVHGRPADHRSDLWAVGCVLYELLTGTRAFRGDTVTGTLAAILERDPDWTALPVGTPASVRRVLTRLLEKAPERRYQSAREVKTDLSGSLARLVSPGLRGVLTRPKVALPAAAVLLALASASAWLVYQGRQRSWARNVALPEIARLLEQGNTDAAFRLGRQAERHIPTDPLLLDLQRHYAGSLSIDSTPPGADVYIKGYFNVDGEWLHVGRTPLTDARVPPGYLRWRLTREGFAPAERAGFSIGGAMQFTLQPPAETPAGMVWVAGGQAGVRGVRQAAVDPFWLDIYEVTNREYKRFVDEGGYSSQKYWLHPFVKGDATLTWDTARAAFRDSTGRPGPATWALGTYPDGQAEYPVGGVSWYEAAAYAEFAGKRLPTIYHWLRAHTIPQSSDILHVSNFSGQGPAPVGKYAGLSPHGNYDMSGNVREWCWNPTSPAPGSPRFIMGASWSEAAYRSRAPSVADPWDRSAHNGFRTARYAPSRDGSREGAIEHDRRRIGELQPVDDRVFDTYRRFYSYEPTELNPTVESVDDSPLHWRQERVSFDAAYGDERVIAYLLLPKNAEPPYQTIVYFASGLARQSRSRNDMASELRFVDFLPRIGRAVLFLIYKGTYERHMEGPATAQFWTRDLVIAWSRDFSRSIDYLKTRPDIDHGNLGYFSFSNPVMPVLSAIDGRIKAGAHIGSGLPGRDIPPEFDALNFAPRAKEPTLLIGGKYDFLQPVETSQRALLRLLGAPDEHKHLALFETGHVVYPVPEMIKQVLDWFDRHLGPVRLKR